MVARGPSVLRLFIHALILAVVAVTHAAAAGVTNITATATELLFPFDTSSAIFVGGLMKYCVERLSGRMTTEGKLRVEEKGTLLASGLIAGEAIIGILLAVVFLAGLPALGQFGFYNAWGGWLSLLGFASLAYVLIRIPMRGPVN